MNARGRLVASAAVAVALLAGCSAAPSAQVSTPPVATPTATAERQLLQLKKVPAPSLAGNLLGDPTEREALILLPPSYFDSDARYPVVYFLDGHQEAVGRFGPMRAQLAKQMQAAGKREFIVVEIDGRGGLPGNFYANSPVSGNVADFVAEDLTGYMDGHYRTVADRTARGLAGFSMGGSGAVNLGLARPDVFGAVYAQSPGLLDPDGGLEAMLQDNGAWPEYAAAFAPDPTATAAPYAHLLDPAKPLAEQDQGVVAGYESGFGDLATKLEAYLAQPTRLSNIRVAYGTNDSYSWIPKGSDYFVGLLDAAGVPHSLRTFVGGHDVDDVFIGSDFVDYFSAQLS